MTFPDKVLVWNEIEPKLFAEKLLASVGLKTVMVEDLQSEGEGCILRIDQWVEIWHAEVEELHIGGKKKLPGFEYGRMVVQHNYPHEPDDYDYNTVGTTRSLHDAIRWCVMQVVENTIDHTITHLAEITCETELEPMEPL